MSRIIRSPAAKRDAIEIWRYIAQDNPPAADALLEDFDRAVKLLARLPGIGTARDELLPGLRSHPVGKYLLFYREARGGIELVRIVHGARDLPKLFRRRRKD